MLIVYLNVIDHIHEQRTALPCEKDGALDFKVEDLVVESFLTDEVRLDLSLENYALGKILSHDYVNFLYF